MFLDKLELLVDSRFATNKLRMRNRDALYAVITAALLPRTKAELGTRAQECRVPLGVVQSFEDVLADAHLAERNMWQQVYAPNHDGAAGSDCRRERRRGHG